MNLVETMNSMYDLVKEGDVLNAREPYRSIFKAMAMQSEECGFFIQTYLSDRFSKHPT